MKNKNKYKIYSVLYLLIAIMSMSVLCSTFVYFQNDPCIYSFSFLIIVSFCWWKSIAGMSKNILKFEIEKLREEVENVSKRED